MSSIFIHPTAEVKSDSIGAGTKIWNQAQVRKGAVIGQYCNIGKNVYVDFDVKLGNNVKIQNNVSLYTCKLKDDVFIGPAVTFTNDLYPRSFIWDDERKGTPIIVKKGASIGANATIITGITIGEYAMVGAASLATKDVPTHALVLGVPAKLKAYICFCAHKLDVDIENPAGTYKCRKCGKSVTLK